MPPWSSLVLALYAALLGALSLYGAHRWVITWHYLRRRGPTPPPPPLPADLPRVTVQLPLYNERNVVERLLNAACALDWPRDRLQIQVLDDSTDDTTAVAQALTEAHRARGVDITLLRRPDRVGYKAGALEAGLATATGTYVAIFDADFLPQPEFLRQTVPWLEADPGVGLVQARWGYVNEASGLLPRLESVLLDGHFVIEHTARNRAGLFFNFNGTAGVWRRTCIADAGGWQHDTVTEDLDLSYRAQLRGWRFVYLPDLVVPSELPADHLAFKNQQHRWAKGSIQTARKLLGPILRSDQPWAVKAEATIHLTVNAAYVGVLSLTVLLPLAVLARPAQAPAWVHGLDLAVFVLTFVSMVRFYGLAVRDAGPGWRGRLWHLPMVFALGMGMALNQARGVWEGWTAADATFVRTPKSGAVGAERRARVRSYAAQGGLWVLGELILAVWSASALVACLWVGRLGSAPWMALFAVGFAYVGVGSLVSQRARQRLAELQDGLLRTQPASRRSARSAGRGWLWRCLVKRGANPPS